MIVAWNNLMLMGRICGSFIHVKGQDPWLHSEFLVILVYMRPHLKNISERREEEKEEDMA